MNAREHWDGVYGRNSAASVSWFAPHLSESLRYVRAAAPTRSSSIIDVGGGESTLVDDLLNEGYTNLTVLDISEKALNVTRERLGAFSKYVAWRAQDILESELPANAYDVWHDRAVFHFLTESDQRRRYVENVRRAVRPNGFVIVGTFGPEGPQRCSDLPVARYDPEGLHREFGYSFELVRDSVELHHTPRGGEQQFVYCLCRRVP